MELCRSCACCCWRGKCGSHVPVRTVLWFCSRCRGNNVDDSSKSWEQLLGLIDSQGLALAGARAGPPPANATTVTWVRKLIAVHPFMWVHARAATHALCTPSQCQDNAESLYQLADKYDMQVVCAHISRCVMFCRTAALLHPCGLCWVGGRSVALTHSPPPSSRRSLCLLAAGPSGLMTSPFSPAYALKWLSMAERFQVREWCRW